MEKITLTTTLTGPASWQSILLCRTGTETESRRPVHWFLARCRGRKPWRALRSFRRFSQQCWFPVVTRRPFEDLATSNAEGQYQAGLMTMRGTLEKGPPICDIGVFP